MAPAARVAPGGCRAGDVVGDVRGAGGMSPEDNLARIAAVPRNVGLEPSHDLASDPRCPTATVLGRQPIVDVDADHAAAHRPEHHVVVERRAFRSTLRAARKPAAVHEHDHRFAGSGVGRREHVENVALVRAVREVARDAEPRVRFLRLQRRIELGGFLRLDPRADRGAAPPAISGGMPPLCAPGPSAAIARRGGSAARVPVARPVTGCG